jgi:hypothetical protein
MKKFIFISLLAFSLMACSKHDSAYYENHIDAANNKLSECEAEFGKALMSQDENKLDKLQKDEACSAAQDGKQAYENKRAQLKKDADTKKFNEGYQKSLSALQSSTFQQVFDAKKKCDATFTFTSSPECKAASDVYAQKEDQEVTALIAKYLGEPLKQYSASQCTGLQYDEANCQASKKALTKQYNDQVANYLVNRDALKTDFNQCYAQLNALRKNRKWDASMQYQKTFKCETALGAAYKLNVYSYSKPL